MQDTVSDEQKLRFGKAVVVGAGVAGLSAARSLAEFFEWVVIIERDNQDSDESRPGVPQGRQPHVLMAGGFAPLMDFFPDFARNLEAAGAIPLEVGRDVQFEIPGVGTLPRRDFGLPTIAVTRPKLEKVIRDQLKAWDNVELVRGTRVSRLLLDKSKSRIVGLEYRTASAVMRHLTCDLVVDASGRGAPTIRCLEDEGYGLPPIDIVGVDIGYSTATFVLSPSTRPDFIGLLTYPRAPENSRGGYMMQIGEDSWQVLLVGRGNDMPPGDLQGFMDFARSLWSPTLATMLMGARQVEPIVRYQYRQSRWVHYGMARQLPSGLMPIGDAICHFNPAYGQGMSVAVQQAMLLRKLAAQRGETYPMDRLVSDFLAATEELLLKPWAMSSLQDFLYPSTTGNRPEDIEEILGQSGAKWQQAVTDPEIHRALIHEQQLVPLAQSADYL
jgi:flavin-dependent dehydrogenase